MNIIGSNIRKLRKSKGMTQQQLAEKVGASTYTTVSKWESGSNSPKGKDLIILSNLFNISVDSILGVDEEVDDTISTSKYTFVPAKVAAGTPELINGITDNEFDEIRIPDQLMGKYAGQSDIFFMKVNGESMNKTIPNQSLIAVKPIEFGQLKNDDVVVYSCNGEYSVKRFYQLNDHVVFRPESTDNSFFDQIFSTDDNLILHGKVVVYVVELD